MGAVSDLVSLLPSHIEEGTRLRPGLRGDVLFDSNRAVGLLHNDGVVAGFDGAGVVDVDGTGAVGHQFNVLWGRMPLCVL